MDGSLSQVWSGLSYPSAITVGPDGNLWVTGASQDVVARVTPAGKGTLFSLDLNCDPQWIAPGAGALWVTCYNLDEIERVSTSGAVTRIPVPSHFPGYPDVLSGIAQGPRGAMWFTEYAADRIGRVSTR
jgi:virginiamycin B lyase